MLSKCLIMYILASPYDDKYAAPFTVLCICLADNDRKGHMGGSRNERRQSKELPLLLYIIEKRLHWNFRGVGHLKKIDSSRERDTETTNIH